MGERKIMPHQKLQLLRELADGKMSGAQLAEKYGVSTTRIYGIRDENKERIEAIKADYENAFAGLWIAQKENRIAVYQEQAERLADSDDPKLVARTQTALRSVAEEMGHLPTRAAIQSDNVTVHNTYSGVDPEQVT